MPTNRTKRTRQARRGVISGPAVEAYRDGDSARLNRELGLPAWYPSPLEPDVEPLIAPPIDADMEEAVRHAKRLRADLESIA